MKHVPVLLHEAIDLLNVSSGVYVDATYGAGGHTKLILQNLDEKSKLIAFDCDITAVNNAKTNDERFDLVHANYSQIPEYLKKLNLYKINGVLFDLGLSTMQIADADRGFSFSNSGPLDMRMDTRGSLTAMDILQTWSLEELTTIFKRYGEERHAKRIANDIVNARNSLNNTKNLADIVQKHVSYTNKHPATRIFQAIRIAVNDELTHLKSALENIVNYIDVGGRVVVISFHSLEDRIVKTIFSELCTYKKLPKWVLCNADEPSFKHIAKKIKPSGLELIQNPSSRSAVMRCIERVKNS